MDPDVVRLRVLNKAHGVYVIKSLQQSLADAVHPIHYTAIPGENYRERKIAVEHEARMFDHITTSQLPIPLI
jgi:hypothetical protein